MEKREVFVLWLEKIVSTLQGQKKKREGKTSVILAYLKQGCPTCSSRRARGSTHATSLLALCVFRYYAVQKVEKVESGKKYCMF